MPRINYVQRARKPQGNCGKCGAKIKAGEPYKWFKRRYGTKQSACAKCDFRESDLTGAKYGAVLAVKEGSEDFIGNYGGTDVSEISSALQDVADAARECGDEYRESAESQRGHFQGSESADNWDSYADELDCYADSLESFDFQEFEDWKADQDEPSGDAADDFENDWRAEASDEAGNALEEFPYPSF